VAPSGVNAARPMSTSPATAAHHSVDATAIAVTILERSAEPDTTRDFEPIERGGLRGVHMQLHSWIQQSAIDDRDIQAGVALGKTGTEAAEQGQIRYVKKNSCPAVRARPERGGY